MRLQEEYMIEKLLEYAREEQRTAERRGLYRRSEGAPIRKKAVRIKSVLWLIRLLGIKR